MKKRVIIVEDDSAIVDIYATIIKKAGFEVETMGLGQQLVKRIQDIQSGEEKTKTDLILLDLILPDMNGMAVLSQLRKNSATKDISVFILTNQDESEAMSAESAKPDKFIVKANITPTQLVELIKNEMK